MHRPADAVGDQQRARAHQLGADRDVGEGDGPGQDGDHRAVGVADLGGEAGGAVLERDAAPEADRDIAGLVDPGAFEGDRIDRAAAVEQAHALAGQMLDRDPDDRRARIVVDLGEEPGDARLLAGEPVALGAGGDGVGGRGGTLGGAADGVGARRGFGGVEIGAHQRAALPRDEAREGAAAGADVARAIDRGAIGGQGRVVELDDMGARHHAFEMVEAVGVGDGVAAVLEHDSDAADAGPGPRIDAAAAVDDPADDRHPVEDRLAADPHQGVGDVAEIAARAGGLGAVERVAAARVGADLEHVGQNGLRARARARAGRSSARRRRHSSGPVR